MDKEREANYILCIIVLIIYILNRLTNYKWPIAFVRQFMMFHFNDLMFGILILAFVAIIMSFVNKRLEVEFAIALISLLAIEIELVTPIFLTSITGDIVDSIMYYIGIPLYFVDIRILEKWLNYLECLAEDI